MLQREPVVAGLSRTPGGEELLLEVLRITVALGSHIEGVRTSALLNDVPAARRSRSLQRRPPHLNRVLTATGVRVLRFRPQISQELILRPKLPSGEPGRDGRPTGLRETLHVGSVKSSIGLGTRPWAERHAGSTGRSLDSARLPSRR